MLFSAVTTAVVVMGVDDDIVNVPSLICNDAFNAVTSLLTWSIPVSAFTSCPAAFKLPCNVAPPVDINVLTDVGSKKNVTAPSP